MVFECCFGMSKKEHPFHRLAFRFRKLCGKFGAGDFVVLQLLSQVAGKQMLCPTHPPKMSACTVNANFVFEN